MSSPRYPRFIDLFAGIGGFRIAAESLGWSCVFSSEMDARCRDAYQANFGERPYGDIRLIDAEAVPDHEVLLAGFPCQPFSIMGKMNGLRDVRGTLFYEIERIVRAKRPEWVVLENVKQLISNDGGATLKTILGSLDALGYDVGCRVLNALDFGVPQKRERVFIVGNRVGLEFDWDGLRHWPSIHLDQVLETAVSGKHFASARIREKRLTDHQPEATPSIWHENRAGHISSYPYSCALRANASHNYLLVDGVRRLTPREMLRLQGFPDDFKIVCSDAQTRKQAGNAVAVPVARAVLEQVC